MSPTDAYPANDLPAYRHLDDPQELAEISREVAGRADGPRRREAVLTLDGVHCSACARTIETALAEVVDEITVNSASRRARVVWQPDKLATSALFGRIAQLGYGPRPVSRQALASVEAAGRRKALWRMLVAVLCMMQVMMYAWPRYIARPGDMSDDVLRLMHWAEWMLALPVMLFAAGPFFANAWRDLRHRRIGMDVPVALGILVTFVASSAGMMAGEEVHFDSLAMFVAFLLVARWLEAGARERALAGVVDLMARLPEMVERLLADGRSETVAVRRLAVGEKIRVAVGQAIPADGVVVGGRSHTDESLLSGESRPIAKSVGDPVVAGSINLSGPLVLRLTRTAAQSRLREIADLIDQASAKKPHLAQIADRWAGVFLAGILVLAAITWLIWQWIDPSRAIWIAAALLIVTCPCALALATPTAIIAAAGRLAHLGVLARSPQAIEALARTDTFLFDKTGTLTDDRLALSRVQAESGESAEALAMAAALEAGSLHPLARALVNAAADLPRPEVREVRETAGAGVQGELWLDGRWRAARLGSAAFAFALDRPVTAGVRAHATASIPASMPDVDRPEEDPSRVVLTVEGRLVARFELAETLRPDAQACLADLAQAGARLALVSGDSADRVAVIAGRLGLTDWQAQASPEDKLQALARYHDQGARVAMVGDGLNDAPVLAQADVSVAVATGAPLAQHQADFLLLSGRLAPLAQARALSVRTMRIIRQNLALAMLYNLIAIPAAMAGWVPPWLAGLGMAASSLVVVANALRVAPRLRQHPAAAGSGSGSGTTAACPVTP